MISNPYFMIEDRGTWRGAHRGESVSLDLWQSLPNSVWSFVGHDEGNISFQVILALFLEPVELEQTR